MHDTARHADLDLALVRPCPSNPRRVPDDAAQRELEASVRQAGILQPVLVRRAPDGDGYELVCGHRRLAAARAAGLDSIPATIRDLSDADVLELQLAENIHRADLHPIDEAEGLRRLHEDYGVGVEDLAAKVGRSTAYVYQRLKLCALPEGARRLFLEGALTAATALLVARIPSAEAAEKAARAIAGLPEEEDEATDDAESERDEDRERTAQEAKPPLTYRAAQSLIKRCYMHVLAEAPWEKEDGDLGAEACARCPRRTSAQAALFADMQAEDDRCVDLECWSRKGDLFWSRLVREGRTLPAADAKAVFCHGFVDEYAGWWSLRGWAARQSACGDLAQRLGDALPPIVYGRDPRSGQVIEFVRTDQARKALRALGGEQSAETLDAEVDASRAAAAAARKREKDAQEKRRAAVELALAAIAKKARWTNEEGLGRKLVSLIGERLPECARSRAASLVLGARAKGQTWPASVGEMTAHEALEAVLALQLVATLEQELQYRVPDGVLAACVHFELPFATFERDAAHKKQGAKKVSKKSGKKVVKKASKKAAKKAAGRD